ncbi:hypothetical protein FJ250_01220 [bacterium]|nr:hypothetical protein [bacterium]
MRETGRRVSYKWGDALHPAGLAADNPLLSRACSSSWSAASTGPADAVTAARRAAFGATTPQVRCLCRRGGVTSWASRSSYSIGVSSGSVRPWRRSQRRPRWRISA